MKTIIKRALCAILGHRWVYTSTFQLFGDGQGIHRSRCKRCGLDVEGLQ